MTIPWDLLHSKLQNCKELFIAAPYIKEGPVRMLLRAAPQIEHLTCVSRWSPRDIAQGASDSVVRELIVRAGGRFLIHPKLHAKYYRTDETVLVGSANMTSAGMGLVSLSNLEILCPPGENFDATAFESSLLRNSREVEDAEYLLWRQIPVQRLNVDEDSKRDSSDWRPIARDPEDVWLVYQEGRPVHLSDSARQNAIEDLSNLQMPGDLSRNQFDSWIRAALLSSAFVLAVRSIARDAEPQAFIELGERWLMDPGQSRYESETVHNWLAHFGLN